MHQLLATDVNKVIAELPSEVIMQLQTHHDIVLAGGCIRSVIAGEPIKDIDVFCKSREMAYARATDHLFAELKQSICSFTVQLGRASVQYVFYSPFSTPEDLINQFDFRMCSAAIWWEPTLQDWQSVYLPGFYEDIAEKRLKFMERDKDSGTLIPLKRAMRFVSRGWTIADQDIAEIIHHFHPAIETLTAAKSMKYSY